MQRHALEVALAEAFDLLLDFNFENVSHDGFQTP